MLAAARGETGVVVLGADGMSVIELADLPACSVAPLLVREISRFACAGPF
jgi:hypothetical protein